MGRWWSVLLHCDMPGLWCVFMAIGLFLATLRLEIMTLAVVYARLAVNDGGFLDGHRKQWKAKRQLCRKSARTNGILFYAAPWATSCRSKTAELLPSTDSIKQRSFFCAERDCERCCSIVTRQLNLTCSTHQVSRLCWSQHIQRLVLIHPALPKHSE